MQYEVSCKKSRFDTFIFGYSLSFHMKRIFSDSNFNLLSNITNAEECLSNEGVLEGEDCDYEPNVFLMSVILFIGAFVISIVLKNFRNTGYLPGKIRNFLSDFAVIIAIFSMTTLDSMAGVKTPKLMVPDSFKPTFEGREWVVTHALMFADHFLSNPW